MKSVSTYLLNEDNFILQLDYMFIKRENYEIGLVYYPGYRKSVQKQLVHLVECFMKCMDYNDYEAVQLIYHCYSCLTENGCTFDRIQGILENDVGNRSNSFIGHLRENKSISDQTLKTDKKGCEEEIHADSCIMDEQVEDQEEVGYYPWWCYAKFIAEAVVLVLIACMIFWRGDVIFGALHNIKLKILGIGVIIFAGGWWLIHQNFEKLDQRTKLKVVQKYVSYKDSEEKIVGSIPNIYNQDICIRKQIQDVSYDKSRLAQIEEPQTVLLSYEEEETQVLASKDRELRLYTKDNREIMIHGDQIIGSGVHADIRLENRMISREHAKIIKDKEDYFIMDLQSTNGTFVNNCSILMGEKLPLHGGDIIKIANEEWIVG